MPIQSIPEITVDGVDLPVYSFDFIAGVHSKPSEIRIAFIDEDGTYSLPTLSVTTPITITVGDDYVFNFYLIERTLTKATEGGRIMTLRYVDRSIILDKIQVGLKNKMGEASAMPLLIVGTEVDPCGDPDAEEVADPCNPCTTNGGALSEGNRTTRNIECEKARLYNILDVDYNFNELLDEIENSAGIQLGEFRPTTNDTYRNQYVGSLRQVLQSWGSDYGFTFYWDDEEDSLLFQDLRGGIPINSDGIDSGDNVISTTDIETLDGTVSKGGIAYYQRAGELRQYECDNQGCKIINLRPITLDQVVPANFISNVYQSPANFEFCVALSAYSNLLRDVHLLKNVYQIKDRATMKAKEGTNLLPFGMNIVTVLDPDSDPTHKSFETHLKTLYMSQEQRQRFNERNGYFFKARYDPDIHSKYHEMESALASQFVGRYFYRRFTQSFKGTNYSYLTPDGDNLKYYRRAAVAQLPFANVLPAERAKAKSWLSSLVDPTTGEASDHFLLLERNGIWKPNPQESEELNTIIDAFSPIQWEILGNVADFNREGTDEWIRLNDELKEKWMIGYEIDDDVNIVNAGVVEHPDEVENTDLRVEACNISGTIGYGLRDAQCRAYKINLKGTNVIIYMPAQGQITGGSDGAGYDIIWEQGSWSNTINVEQGKIELVEQTSMPNLSDNTMAIEVTHNDVTQNVYDIYSSEIDSICEPLEGSLRTYMKNAINGLDFGITSPFVRQTYVIAGLPPQRYTIADGLESLSVRIGSNGMETTISFGNRQKEPIGQNLFQHQITSWQKRGANTVPNAVGAPQQTEWGSL